MSKLYYITPQNDPNTTNEGDVSTVHVNLVESWMHFPGDERNYQIYSTEEILLLLEALHLGKKIVRYETPRRPGASKFRMVDTKDGLQVNLFKYFKENMRRAGTPLGQQPLAHWVSDVTVYREGAKVTLFGNQPREIFVTEINSIVGLCWAMFARNPVGVVKGQDGYFLQMVLGNNEFPDAFRRIPTGGFSAAWRRAFGEIRF